MVSNNSRTQWLQIVCARNYSYRTIRHTVRFHTMHDHMEPYDVSSTTIRNHTTHHRTELYKSSYNNVWCIIHYHMTHHMIPYDTLYSTVWHTIQCTIIRNRTTHHHAELYDPLYNTVWCIVSYRTTHHRMELYDPSYNTVRPTIWHTVRYCMTHYCTEPYDTVQDREGQMTRASSILGPKLSSFYSPTWLVSFFWSSTRLEIPEFFMHSARILEQNLLLKCGNLASL